jgi:CRP-like cAMP-binding protein
MEGLRGVCPDCPVKPRGALGALVDPKTSRCALRCLFVPARHPLPPRWFGAYGLALVRRGILVRQRVDAGGSATSVDAVGPGGAAPLLDSGEATSGGYAADDSLVCLLPKAALKGALDAGAPTAGHVVTLHLAALERVERIADARGRSTAHGRVAALLCALADTLAPPRRLDTVPVALQQRDMASLLTMRHESVCRALGALERRRWLVRGSEGIRLLDRPHLEAAARPS